MRKLFKVLGLFIVFIIFTDNTVFALNKSIKEPNVSGIFYPNDKKELSATIEKMINNARPLTANTPISGIISPHAGYIYSGEIAAMAYKTIYGKSYSTVVILAPSHYQNIKKAAIFKSGAFKTPLGQIPIDSNFTTQLLKYETYFEANKNAFNKEHSLEVQLPFLQKSLDSFSIVPILILPNSYEYYEQISNILASMISGREDVLIIASTDMSHFKTQEKAKAIDNHTLSFIRKNDTHGLFRNLNTGNCELCGGAGLITLMLTMKKLGADKVQILDYATSADTTNSSKNRVVGYFSAVYAKSTQAIQDRQQKRRQIMLTQEQKKELLSIARTSISDYLISGKRPDIKTTDPLLLEKRGAFVTLSKKKSLRGCIGRIASDIPLIQVISEMAIEAAVHDPRFPKVSEKELGEIELEISVMSPIEEITDISRIKVGTHGIIIKKGFSSGLLLPQVAAEYNWNTEQFLEQTCIKAGLNQHAWKKGAKIFIFSAEVFNEAELN